MVTHIRSMDVNGYRYNNKGFCKILYSQSLIEGENDHHRGT